MDHPWGADRVIQGRPMKTLGEFLQRLENDSLFEKQAQAFNNGDDLMAFVESEGYDFTLEELTSAFKQKAQLPPETGDTAPATPGRQRLRPSWGGGYGDSRKSGSPTPQRNKYRLTESGEPRLAPGAIKAGGAGTTGRNSPKGPGGKSTAGLFRGGGGRHRGFSPERLKCVLGEDS